jgi:hypothetical protein
MYLWLEHLEGHWAPQMDPGMGELEMGRLAWAKSVTVLGVSVQDWACSGPGVLQSQPWWQVVLQQLALQKDLTAESACICSYVLRSCSMLQLFCLECIKRQCERSHNTRLYSAYTQTQLTLFEFKQKGNPTFFSAEEDDAQHGLIMVCLKWDLQFYWVLDEPANAFFWSTYSIHESLWAHNKYTHLDKKGGDSQCNGLCSS